jgi:hypothetical protein
MWYPAMQSRLRTRSLYIKFGFPAQLAVHLTIYTFAILSSLTNRFGRAVYVVWWLLLKPPASFANLLLTHFLLFLLYLLYLLRAEYQEW